MFFLSAPAMQRRRRRSALGEGREVLVYIDEPLPTTPAPPENGPVPSPASPPVILPNRETTPVRRNRRPPAGRRNSSRPAGPRSSGGGHDAVDRGLLSVPDLRAAPTDDSGGGALDAKAPLSPRVGSDPSGGGGPPSRESGVGLTDDSELSDCDDDDDYDDDEDEDEDDDALRREEAFERAVINVSPSEGCVVLEYAEPAPGGEATAPPADDDGDDDDEDDDGDDSDWEGASDSGDSRASDSLAAEGGAAAAAEGGGGSAEPAHHRFELASTNVHSAENDRKRERDKVRLSVLGAAADAYKRAKVEVPDIMICEINEIRETLRRGSIDDLSGGEHKRTDSPGRKRERKRGRIGKQTKTRSKRRKGAATKDHVLIKDTDVKREEKQPNVKLKRLKLRSEDEIHALPCQCALTLVGMRGLSVLSPVSSSPGENSGGDLVASFTRTFFGERSDACTQRTPMRRPSLSLPHSAPARPPKRNSSLLSSISLTDSVRANESSAARTPSKKAANVSDANMVRTSSAKAEDTRPRAVPSVSTPDYNSPTLPLSPIIDGGSTPLKLGGPPDPKMLRRARSGSGESIFPTALSPTLASQQQRFESSLFTSMDYHEIVIIRKGGSVREVEHGFMDWDAVTIRCHNHDEMDIVIKALKTCAKSTVVPFSPNPKANLKKKQERERAELKKHKSALKACRRRQRRSKIGTINSPTAPSSRACPKPRRLSLNGTTNDKSEESRKWNKCKMCEICNLQFNLIVRRHHCRKCDRSCCSDCSALLLLRSGKEKRYCKDCSPNIDGRAKNVDDKWNKNDHCEMCKKTFTLLTRRHHCRKCDRSCCGDCSSVLLVRGGEEKRCCNRCSTNILRRQSRDLHRRFAGYHRRSSLATLPGKVHNECRHLGVGVWGKLPHWKNYLAFEPCHRPAVGRITVELLEALAIPSININWKADPYVKVTITGYDRDMCWALKEWLPSKRFSLCSSYCSGTLSPVWRGSGRKGGELLTLPVISTAGAVLRLEVMHYDVMTNARGKDSVLGVVEIPLSDITNANLRTANSNPAVDGKKRKKLSYDGYCDRWYQLQSSVEKSELFVSMSKPIANPHLEEASESPSDGKSNEQDLEKTGPRLKRSNSMKVGAQSLEEIGQHVQNWFRAPVDWVGSALRIDIPRRRLETASAQHRSRSSIHVRLKLNCNEVGDLLSHVWFPPVEPYPPMPPYDPQVLWRNIVCVQKHIKPYLEIIKFIEDTIKWRQVPKTCVLSYAVFAFHIGCFPYLLYFFHFYLFVFLWAQFQKMKRPKQQDVADEEENTQKIHRTDSFGPSFVQMDSISSDSDVNTVERPKKGVSFAQPDAGSSKNEHIGNPKTDVITPPSLEDLSPHGKKRVLHGREKKENKSSKETDETARLNKAVEWVARRLGDNRGLEIAQFKLGMFGRDITNFNSLWDGSSMAKTCASMIALAISFVLHCYFSWRLLWIFSSAVWFLGSSPFSIRRARNCLGIWRGVIKVTRRRHLHKLEVKEQSKE